MTIRPKIRNAALVGALAAVAATAWATNETHATSSSAYYVEPRVALVEEPVVTTSSTEVVEVRDTLAPNETVVITRDAAVIPVVEHSVAQPAITVEDRRMSEDERIQSLVMDRIASNRNLSGKIGVESHDSVVRLSGYTLTAGQAYRAGREAGSVVGVKYVQNEIRPRIGGSV